MRSGLPVPGQTILRYLCFPWTRAANMHIHRRAAAVARSRFAPFTSPLARLAFARPL